MTNLTIQQSVSSTENVSTAIIDKLYRLALNSKVEDPDNVLTMSLLGNITAPAAYEDAVMYLRAKFPNLIINVTDNNYYIRFKDPVIALFCIDNYSTDGIGVTRAQAGSISINSMNNDTKSLVTSLNDILYFTNNVSGNDSICLNFSNATEIKFANTTYAYNNVYTRTLISNCKKISNVDYSNAQFIVTASNNNGIMNVIGENDTITDFNDSLIPNLIDFDRVFLFDGWTKLTKVIYKEGIVRVSDNYKSCTNMLYIEYPTTITSIGSSYHFGRNSGHRIPAMVIKAITPPNWNKWNPNDSSGFHIGFGWGLMPSAIYVPDNSVTAYKSVVNGGTNDELAWASDYIKDLIKPLSELPQIYRDMGTVTQEDIDRV